MMKYLDTGIATRFTSIMKQVSYKEGWRFRLNLQPSDLWLQVVISDVEDARTGEISDQYCRKWRLSEHMVDSEIVQTAFKAIEAAEAHEIRENFKYKGVLIYDPHISIDEMVEFTKTASHEVRK